MSIIEKAVGKSSGGHRSLRVARSAPKASQRSLAARNSGGANVISLSGLSERGMVTVLENEDLSKSFRFLKRSVLAKVFSPQKSNAAAGKMLMVTSAMPGAGKSFLALNLAASIAREKLIDVVLIDADPVRHHLSTVIGVDDRAGLIDVLISEELDSVLLETDVPGLHFIPAGSQSDAATELFASQDMSAILAALSDPNTVIILDSTPILISSESDAVAQFVDHAIIVVEAGVTSVDELDTVIQMLKKSGASINFVMNKVAKTTKAGVPDHYSVPY